MASSFTLEDIRRLEKTIGIRERLLDHLTSGELPKGARDVEVLTSLAESMDRSIFSKAKISIDEANNKINEETKEVLRDLLLDLHKNTAAPTAADGQPVAPREAPTFAPSGMNVNEGEMIHKQDTADVNKFLEQRQTEEQ